MAYFSIIIPVYNRLDEVRDLLDSLSKQTDKDFEVVLVEDGSTLRCDAAVKEFEDRVDVKYFYKENEGRSIARNYGMERASGEYFLFFDSDCVIPEHYIATLRKALEERPTDCFGGPDAAHSSFSDTQKRNQLFDDVIPYHRRNPRRQGAAGEIRAAHVQHGLLTPGVGEGGRIPRDVFRRHRHEHAHTPGWIRDIADSRGLRLSQAARKHAAVLPSGLRVRHVAHHALSALS